MARAVIARDAGPIEHEDDGAAVEAHVEVGLIEGAAEEGRVHRDDRSDARHGHTGGSLSLIHIYTVMAGYWQDEEETSAVIDAEGWLRTGDIGVMDLDGNVAIVDRVKDMFVVGGFNAYPAEIEAMLRLSLIHI